MNTAMLNYFWARSSSEKFNSGGMRRKAHFNFFSKWKYNDWYINRYNSEIDRVSIKIVPESTATEGLDKIIPNHSPNNPSRLVVSIDCIYILAVQKYGGHLVPSFIYLFFN